MSIDARLLAATAIGPEMASLNMDPMSFGIFPVLQKYTASAHDWQCPFLDMTEDLIFPNTFRTVRYAIEILGGEHGTNIEFECCGLGHLCTVKCFVG